MNLSKTKKRVTFITLTINEYKKHVYCSLANNPNVEFKAFHGKEPRNIPPYDIGLDKDFPNELVKNLYVCFKGKVVFAFQLLFIKLYKYNPDVIILHDGVRILSNYLILLYAWMLKKKIIWYTHGESKLAKGQSRFKASILEFIRKAYFKKAHALIAYTEGSKDALIKKGIDEKKIFISPNTLDVDDVLKAKNETTETDLHEVRNKLSLGSKKVICFIGRFAQEKMPLVFIDLLVGLNKKNPDKYFGIMIGSGPLENEIRKKIDEYKLNNVYLTGFLGIHETSKYLLNSDIVFIPGMTGLSIVHSFCFGLPYVTFDLDIHSPEIEYLKNNKNGLITNLSSFVDDIHNLLMNENTLNEMKKNALIAIKGLTVEKQMEGFLRAIEFV